MQAPMKPDSREVTTVTNLLIALAFAAGFLMIFGVNLVIADLFEVNRQRLRKRFEEDLQLRQRERARGSLQYLKPSDTSNDTFFDTDSQLTLREKLVRYVEVSGVRMRWGQLMVMCIGVAAVAGLAIWRLSGSGTLAVLATPFGAALPVLYVSIVRARRLERLLSQLPDAFDLMSRTLRAGQTTSQAMQAVADEFSAPVAEEFGYCYDQQNLGLSPEAALRDLAARTGLLELKIFVLAMMIHRQTGGNLANLLGKLATVIRERYRIRGVIKALTADGRLQAVILLALPPGMFFLLSIINRPYVEILFQHPMLLVTVVTSMTVGGLWMKRIINFDF